ncbi:MAG: large ribosomal subunit protein bL28 [Deltaproteobacteria bacterium]
MLRVCAICAKKPMTGKSVVRKGLLKKKGGTGSKIVRSNKRKFLPNLQKLRIKIGGHTRQAYVCTKCMKAGLVVKAA